MKKFLNKKVAVVGLGIVGSACLKYLLDNGATVTVHDKKDTEEMRDKISNISDGKNVATVLGENYLSDLTNYDFITLSPGINPNNAEIEAVRATNIPIHNDMTLFLEELINLGLSTQTVGITGSNGKSTVATLTYELLIANGVPAKLGGNIGVSPLLWLDDEIDKNTVMVLEVSSYALEQFRDEHYFDTFVLTSISENHSDRYPLGIESYIKTKLKGLKNGHTKFIISDDNENFICDPYKVGDIRNWAETEKIVSISLRGKLKNGGMYVKEDGSVMLLNKNKEGVIVLSNIHKRKISGDHNAYNILYALASIANHPFSLLTNDNVIKNFKGLPHRTELIAEINGVKYINDSKSTSPDATRQALALIGNKTTILIAGGVDKNSNFKTLENSFLKYVKCLVLLPGTASAKIGQSANKNVGSIIFAKDMKDAVKKAVRVSEEGDTILLSPGSASFNLFKNFEDRGEHFVAEVEKLK